MGGTTGDGGSPRGMSTAFEAAFLELMRWEVGGRPNGGYTNDPLDPGGETKYGISKRSYPELDIKALTEPQAREICERDYWVPLRLDEVTREPVSRWMFLWAFNTSYPPGKSPGTPVKAVKDAQEVCNWFLASDLAVDGQMGAMTLAALNSIEEKRLLLGFFARAAFKRVSRVRERPDQERFMYGWLRRDAESAGLAVPGPG